MDIKNLAEVPAFQSLCFKPGDAIAIPPGKKHKLWNTGAETLHLLCCCAPGYEHDDTVITEK